jgi:hypothetical protein
MTAVPTDARFTAAQLAALERIEAAPDAEESLRETVARALWTALGDGDLKPWTDADDWEWKYVLGLADAALAVIAGTR